ncbi:hypothetical protein P170DRAFT_243999 [Aspergillus steynii IBT 23096]|uniref:Zn(2)-C6 fungal-type domain-containing protein n=1 Tax=Aspergillus steynii IBT 23096 TaxID=1392250 RepID=A0A2I2FXX5_9EURO|nr:uncharacterized protein P170DRAFT_243999 [Aspergillus steynii IBT 23096]PLB45436.1 hypothetical protein P170DRAFT_243999 [Aspergillus steynii IBT 23096]
MSAYGASSSSVANGAAVAGPGIPGKVPIAPLGEPPVHPNERPIRSYRRSRSGCFTCRLRRKKCDETRRSCETCTKLGLKCEYKIPHWWSTGEKRRRQKDRIKDRIRQTKVMEKHGSFREYMDRIRALTERSPKTSEKESNRPMMGEQYNWDAPLLPPATPCNINVTSETFISPGFPSSLQASSPSSMSFTPVNAPQGPMSSQMQSQLPSPMSTQMSTDIPVPTHGLSVAAQAPAETAVQVTTEMAPPAPVEMSTQLPTQACTEMTTPQLTSPTPAEIAAQLPIQLQTQVRTQMPIIMPVQVPPSPQLPVDGWFGINNHSMNQNMNNDMNNGMSTMNTMNNMNGMGMNSMNPVSSNGLNNFGQLQHYPAMDVPGFAYPYGSLPVPLQTVIPLDEKDSPFLDHFVENVLRLAFPIVDLHQVGQFRLKEIFRNMRFNRSFLHCCLSVSAIHMKTSLGLEDQMDHDIMKHRYEAISQLCRALGRGYNPITVIDATLGMIYYHCKISNTDDYLPDIPWSAHFLGVATLVKKLQHSPSQFNISLITWIDILGSTMTGTTPHFAHAYRTKHLKGSLSGLRGLMGCDDGVMYLISEITCLEHLRLDGEINDEDMKGHVDALRAQIEWTEPTDRSLQHPYTSNGAVGAMSLTKNITSLFRIAARIYLESLLPGFSRFDFTVTDLVAIFADNLDYIPGGLHGYDRCIVWPLFIVGAYSTPACSFRRILTDRIAALGYLGDFASFGRMYRLLREIWLAAEGPITSASDDDEDAPGSPEFVDGDATIRPPVTETQEPAREELHWREIMKRNNWDFLLM